MGERSTNLPPGFRFSPTDEELVLHFLHRKASHLPCRPDIIPTLDLLQCDPWDLNGKALKGGNNWYFFARNTPNRSSGNGYWRPVAIDEPVTSGENQVGIKTTLAFYIGEGIKTKWVMHEYRISDGISSNGSTSSGRMSNCKKRGNPGSGSNEWVICRVHEASCGGFHDDGAELSGLDEVFLSLDGDLDEVSWP